MMIEPKKLGDKVLEKINKEMQDRLNIEYRIKSISIHITTPLGYKKFFLYVTAMIEVGKHNKFEIPIAGFLPLISNEKEIIVHSEGLEIFTNIYDNEEWEVDIFNRVSGPINDWEKEIVKETCEEFVYDKYEDASEKVCENLTAEFTKYYCQAVENSESFFSVIGINGENKLASKVLEEEVQKYKKECVIKINNVLNEKNVHIQSDLFCNSKVKVKIDGIEFEMNTILFLKSINEQDSPRFVHFNS